MKKLLIVMLCLLGAASVQAQGTAAKKDGPVVQFDNTHHDFGTIKEDDGNVQHTYKFKNVGNRNLKLTNVQPACGCTIADYTKDSVAPGGSGYVQATFLVAHKVGRFDKSITVQTNGEPSVMLLTFSGTVLPHVKTLQDSFATVIGNLRFESNSINFDKITNNVKDTIRYLHIYNNSNSPIVIKELKTEPQSRYIFNKEVPFTIPPHKRVYFPVHYNAAMIEDYGIIFDQVKLVTTDVEKPEKTITIFAEIHQYIAPMTDEQKTKAPKIFLPQSDHDFGSIKQGEEVTNEFTFKNNGKNELFIYKVKPSCGCTSSTPSKTRLKAGESSTIKVTFNSAGMVGKETKYVTIYSNDPTNPEATLTIRSNVLAPDSGSK